MKKSKIAILIILSFAGFLRLYRIGSYPALNADEAAIGCNAYSLLKTGRDEHGISWPIHFKSFGDFKPGGYFYLVLPSVAILGLNTLAVRLPAVILSVLTIFIVYKLSELLWNDQKLGLIWALILSISPWHLHFSRGGWESNTAIFFISLGIYFFFAAIKKDRQFSTFSFQFSIFSLIASMYIYHSARLIAPLLFIGLVFFNFQKLWQSRRKFYLPIIVGFLLIFPLSLSFLKGGASSRFSGVGLFADTGPLWRINELRAQHPSPDNILPTILHNRYLGYVLSLAENYFSHFNGNFLFVSGDEVPRSKIPGMGQMHLISFFTLILGMGVFIKSEKIHYKYLPVIWLLISPIASALTFQAPSALRALSMVVPLTFLVAYGCKKLLCIKEKLLRVTSYGLIICGYLWGIMSWWNNYFVHYLQQYPTAWPQGYQEAVEWMSDQPNQAFTIVTKHDQPYILTAFYSKYSPEKMQKEIKLTPPDEFGFSTVRQFGRFTFANLPPENGKLIKEFNQTKIYEQN
jgi:4-amino-4-deoxy-L-arabinose transferase-like glycosyltransferase